SVMVIVVESLTAIDAEVMSCPAVKVMFGVTAVLNSKPIGALNISFTPVPVLKLPRLGLLTSSMMMGPRVVHAGDWELAALSAEILVPPEAGVFVTAATRCEALRSQQPAARSQ